MMGDAMDDASKAFRTCHDASWHLTVELSGARADV